MIEEKVVNALAQFNLPLHKSFHRGKGENYLTWEILNNIPVSFANDEDVYESTQIRIHAFLGDSPFEEKDVNPEKTRQKIKRALRKGGFTIKGSGESYEEDTKYHHITVDAQIENSIDETEEF